MRARSHDDVSIRLLPAAILADVWPTLDAHAHDAPRAVAIAGLAFGFGFSVEAIRRTTVESADPPVLVVPATLRAATARDAPLRRVALDEVARPCLPRAVRRCLSASPRAGGTLLQTGAGQPLTAAATRNAVIDLFERTTGWTITPAALAAARLAEADGLARCRLALEVGYSPSMAIRFAAARIEPRIPSRRETR